MALQPSALAEAYFRTMFNRSAGEILARCTAGQAERLLGVVETELLMAKLELGLGGNPPSDLDVVVAVQCQLQGRSAFGRDDQGLPKAVSGDHRSTSVK